MSRPRKIGGTVYPRMDSVFLWICYRDREGRVVKESTGTADPEQADRFLRERLYAKDAGLLRTVLAGKNLTFAEWGDWFLERRSKPPVRTLKTHLQNIRIVDLFKSTFENTRLLDITMGVKYRGTISSMTVHQEFRVLRRILNVAVKQKRLAEVSQFGGMLKS